MDLKGAQQCFQFLKNSGLKITSFISDRHRGIAKWIRETQTETNHYHDLWHVCKSVTKRVLKSGIEKGCQILLNWMKSIRCHLFWSALSTKQGFGKLIVAKWKSLLNHIADKHENHPDP